MHELSLAQGIVDIIGQYVPEEQLADVRVVRIRVGQMAGVVADSLEFSFCAIVAGTSLEQAKLDIVEVPLKSKCSSCDTEFPVEGLAFSCPTCGSKEVLVTSGTELQVAEIEVAERQVGVS